MQAMYVAPEVSTKLGTVFGISACDSKFLQIEML